MEPVRPLRDVFAELSAAGRPAPGGVDPARVLAEHGHGGLPEGLLAEAIVSYADTAPVEVAEHLAPFVVAHSPVPVGPGDVADLGSSADDAPSVLHGLALLADAPHPFPDDVDPAALDGHAVHPIEDPAHHLGAVHAFGPELQADSGPHVELDFGHGHHEPVGVPGAHVDAGHHLALAGEEDPLAVDHDPGALDGAAELGHPGLGHPGSGDEGLGHEGLGHQDVGHHLDHLDDPHLDDPQSGHGHLPPEGHPHGA
jgi:hypothetical protein